MIGSSPVLLSLSLCSLLQHHLHQSVNHIGSSSGIFILKSQNTENYIVENLTESLQILCGQLHSACFGGIDYPNQFKDGRKGGRSIQVIAKSFIHRLIGSLNLRIKSHTSLRIHSESPFFSGMSPILILRSFPSGKGIEVTGSLHEFRKSLLGCLKSLIREIQSPAIVGLKDEETYGHRAICLFQSRMSTAEHLRQGNEITQTLTHLLSIDGYHIVMHPIMHTFSMAASHILGYLTFVVREHQVHSTTVYVKFASQVLLPHHRALQMPARETLAPW